MVEPHFIHLASTRHALPCSTAQLHSKQPNMISTALSSSSPEQQLMQETSVNAVADSNPLPLRLCPQSNALAHHDQV